MWISISFNGVATFQGTIAVKTERTTIPYEDGGSFCQGVSGAKPMSSYHRWSRKRDGKIEAQRKLRFYFFDELASQRYYLPISSNTQRNCRSASTTMESCVKSDWSVERKEDFGKGVTSTFRHGLT